MLKKNQERASVKLDSLKIEKMSILIIYNYI